MRIKTPSRTLSRNEQIYKEKTYKFLEVLWQWGNHSVALVVWSFHQSNHYISHFWCKFYNQYSSDNIFFTRASNSSECSVWYRQRLEHFFQNEGNKFSKKEPVNFCKFYNSEGSTHLLLLSNHFVSLTIWFLLWGLN